jgi:hypothetical protein
MVVAAIKISVKEHRLDIVEYHAEQLALVQNLEGVLNAAVRRLASPDHHDQTIAEP